MAPFGARPVSARSERSRNRLALALATLGIAAALLAYALSPGVRHAVSHAAHSVKHAVGNVFDRDANKHKSATPSTGHGRATTPPRTPAPATRSTRTQPVTPSPTGP